MPINGSITARRVIPTETVRNPASTGSTLSMMRPIRHVCILTEHLRKARQHLVQIAAACSAHQHARVQRFEHTVIVNGLRQAAPLKHLPAAAFQLRAQRAVPHHVRRAFHCCVGVHPAGRKRGQRP